MLGIFKRGKIPRPEQKTWFNAADLGANFQGHLLSPSGYQIRDLFTGAVLSAFKDRQAVDVCKAYTNYVLSSDERYFAMGCDTAKISVSDLVEKKLAFSLKGHRPSVEDGWSTKILDLAFSPYGSLLASSGNDRAIRFWNPAKGQPLYNLLGHTCPASDIVFSPDGRYLASTGCDGTVRLWGLH